MSEITCQNENKIVLTLEQDAIIEGSDTNSIPKDMHGDITESLYIRKIRIEPRSGSMNFLLERMNNGEIVIQSDSQLSDTIWNDESQSRLIESFMLRIPVPGLYFDGTDSKKWLVVDGNNRLTAIQRFVIKQELRLNGLAYLKEHEGKAFSELPRPLQRAIRDAEIVWYLIMPGTPENVKFELYRRLNTGGLPLSAQEIRHTLNGGIVTRFIRELAEADAFKRATDGSLSGKQIVACECVTRFFVFAVFSPENYQNNDYDAFLNDGMHFLNEHQEMLQNLRGRFLRVMQAAERIFGNDAFRRRYDKVDLRYPINKALFEGWGIALDTCSDSELELLIQRKDVLKKRFIELMKTDKEFEESVTQATGSASKVKCRFSRIQELVEGVLHD